ncbi:MAG: Rpp14/Pop5 family protein [Candidatus Micrarchaeota archaeon]|nr:Rpp14/Pop5 family protein [Candidatus Micrarchaeota archaeon]MDE1834452.1 Rpp14/Pop5 family protein [Candidatus Micrarchaeota archaeon]MDE1859070.1 Rpp14/Pop5 family protein [Candidatus Micrarchaeota archaeon]
MITRPRSRYILVESSEPMDSKDVSTAHSLLSAVAKQVGESGYIELNPRLPFQYHSSTFIMKVNRGSERRAILALSFIKEVNGKRLGLYTIKTSGTIRTLIEYCKRTYK